MNILILFLAGLAAYAQAPAAVRYLTYGGVPTAGDCTLAMAGARVAVDTSTTPDTLYDCVNGAWAKRSGVKGPASATDGSFALFDGVTGEQLASDPGYQVSGRGADEYRNIYLSANPTGANPYIGMALAVNVGVLEAGLWDGSAGLPYLFSSSEFRFRNYATGSYVFRIDPTTGVSKFHTEAAGGNTQLVVQAGDTQGTTPPLLVKTSAGANAFEFGHDHQVTGDRVFDLWGTTMYGELYLTEDARSLDINSGSLDNSHAEAIRIFGNPVGIYTWGIEHLMSWNDTGASLFWSEKAGTATTVTVKAGDTQGTNKLHVWKNNAGVDLFSITANGAPKFSSIAEGTCDVSTRGVITAVFGGSGADDTLRICRKNAADAYAWTALY